MPTTDQTPRIWDFVEKYHPNYDHSDEIGECDLLDRILDKEYNPEREDDSATQEWNGYRRDTDTDEQALAEVSKRRNELLVDIYERSIESFLERQQTIPQRVIISIKNGLPELEQKPEGVEVVIIDHDVLMVQDEPSIYQWSSDDSKLASTEISELLIESNQQH